MSDELDRAVAFFRTAGESVVMNEDKVWECKMASGMYQLSLYLQKLERRIAELEDKCAVQK